MFVNFKNFTTIAKVNARAKVLKFKKALERADNVKVELDESGDKPKLVIQAMKECKCAPEEVGTGVMEEFTETHTFELDLIDLNLTMVSADN